MANFKEYRRGFQPWEHGKGGGGGDMGSSALDHDFVSTAGAGEAGGGDQWQTIAPWIAASGFGAEVTHSAADATAAWLKHHKAHNVMEVGCGLGRGTKRLTSAGLTVQAIEESAALLAAAREALPGAQIAEGNLTDVPRGSYDAVVSTNPAFSRLTMAGQAEAFLESARASLKPGGLLSFIFYNKDGVDQNTLGQVLLRGPFKVGSDELLIYDQWKQHPDGGDRFVWVPLFAPGNYSINWARRSIPYRFWSADEVKQALEDAGFEVTEFVDAEHPSTSGAREAKRVMVRARAR